MDEIVPIPGFSMYGATASGHIWRIVRGKATSRKVPYRMSPKSTKNGYILVSVVDDNGRRSAQRVARLVLTAFRGPQPWRIQAAHGDGCRQNNALSNLRWATAKENAADCLKHGTAPRGDRNGKAKLTNEQVTAVQSLIAAGLMQKEIAHRFGVSRTCIYDISSGKRRQYG